MNHINAIESKGKEFSSYIESIFKEENSKKFWNAIFRYSNAYIFGGVIKDFFFNPEKNHRDIDIVVEELSPQLIEKIETFIIRKNQFGGLKLDVNGLDVDLWEIKKTWAIQVNKPIDFNYNEYLPSTSFFNITAIIFSIRDSRFIMHDKFLKFYTSRKLGIVNENNPYPELCIVKTYEYYKNYSFRISKQLSDYIIKYFKLKKSHLADIQYKHYGEIKYCDKEIEEFVNLLNNEDIPNKRKKPIKFKQELSLDFTMIS